MGLIFGRWDGGTDDATIADATKLIGYPSGTRRQYLGILQPYTGGYIQGCIEHGATLCLSLHSWTEQPRHAIPWRDIFLGRYDDVFLTNLTAYKALGNPVRALFCFHHEPENEETGKVSGDLPAGESCGTRDDFKLAFEHFRAVMRSVLTVDEALLGMTLMQGRYASGEWETWAPPHYNYLGIDGYSHGGSNPESFSKLFTPAHNAAVSAKKRLFIQECGCAEASNAPAFKPNFFAEMHQLTKSWPELIGVEYSNTRAKQDFRIATSDASLRAYQQIAADPYYQGAWS